MLGRAERKGEAPLLEERCKDKMGRGEVMMGYGCMRCLGEEALVEHPIPMASSGQTCAQLAATVTSANKVLGSARSESEKETEDAVRPFIQSGTGARLPRC